MFLSEGISTPLKVNMNIQITHLERKMIFQTSISSMIMFHVNLPGCIADVTAFVTSAFLQHVLSEITQPHPTGSHNEASEPRGAQGDTYRETAQRSGNPTAKESW